MSNTYTNDIKMNKGLQNKALKDTPFREGRRSPIDSDYLRED